MGNILESDEISSFLDLLSIRIFNRGFKVVENDESSSLGGSEEKLFHSLTLLSLDNSGNVLEFQITVSLNKRIS